MQKKTTFRVCAEFFGPWVSYYLKVEKGSVRTQGLAEVFCIFHDLTAID